MSSSTLETTCAQYLPKTLPLIKCLYLSSQNSEVEIFSPALQSPAYAGHCHNYLGFASNINYIFWLSKDPSTPLYLFTPVIAIKCKMSEDLQLVHDDFSYLCVKRSTSKYLFGYFLTQR